MTDLFQINAIASNLGGSIQALSHDQVLKNRIYSTC